MRIKLLLAALVSMLVVGCGGGDTVSETKVTSSGETEGKEPTFKMVPSQKDPGYSGGK